MFTKFKIVNHLHCKTPLTALSELRYGRQNLAWAGGRKTVRKAMRNVTEGEEGGQKHSSRRGRARNLAKRPKELE